jgi:LacI family transcriptional regulator
MISVSNTTTSFEHLKACQESGMPLVFFDRVCETIKAPRITTDDAEVAFKATSLLLKKGCKKITFLSMADNLSISSRRKSGFEKALDEAGLSNSGITIECSPDDENNRLKIRELLQSEMKPDGIFASVEKFAFNIYEVCNEMKIRIPEQLKVVSFSNLSAAALFNPPLSTIVQPAYEMGREAAIILFKVVEKKTLLPKENKITIPSYIVERKSSSK